MSTWPGVFVSSTCFDLIDLRAEAEAHIRDLGLVPILSDRISSEFSTDGTQDSIKTCIENVRKCPTYICVLCRRYGGTLELFGHPGLSATHVEYRAAKKAGCRIMFYVRDRCAADYSVWRTANKKAAKPSKLSWVDEKDYGVFRLLLEHENQATTPNWYWAFRDSVELKRRLTIDLGRESRSAITRRMLQDGRLPTIIPMVKHSGSNEIGFNLDNISSVPAVDVRFSTGQGEIICQTIGANTHGAGSVKLDNWHDLYDGRTVEATLRYTTLEGLRFEERRDFTYSKAAGGGTFAKTRSIELLPDEEVTIV